MKIGNKRCRHCNLEYEFQYSGTQNALDIPKEYQDDFYTVINNEIVVKPGNRRVNVRSYSKININELNKCKKIAIYRHAAEHYRYFIIDDNTINKQELS